jgi:hypothetical protein
MHEVPHAENRAAAVGPHRSEALTSSAMGGIRWKTPENSVI